MEGVGGGGCIGSVGINSFFSFSFPFLFFHRGNVLGFGYCYLQSLFIYTLLYYIYGS